jgi:hypothetical protein
MSTPDIEELRKLAQAATPGIWFHIQRGISRWHGERIEVDLNPICDFAMLQDCCVHEYDRAYENAAYIQAANPSAIIGLIDTIQAQAERIKELELDLDVQAGSIEAVQAVNARQAERIKELEWQLAEIEKAEPVIWAISYDGVTPYTLWHEGDGALLDLEVKRQGGTTQKMPLFTRPVPAQPIIGLQAIHDAITADPSLAGSDAEFDESQFKSVEDLIAHLNKLNSYRDKMLEALSKYKGAK